jgi:hypothetical protein
VIGRAWTELATELEGALREDDPGASVRSWIDANGCLRFEVRVERERRSKARAKARSFEARAAGMCESCGGELGHTRAAAGTAIFLCPSCTGG